MGTAAEKPVEAMHVACEMCLKEVPASEAVVAEATDYFAYFCGHDCYERWKHRGEGSKAAAGAREALQKAEVAARTAALAGKEDAAKAAAGKDR